MCLRTPPLDFQATISMRHCESIWQMRNPPDGHTASRSAGAHARYMWDIAHMPKFSCHAGSNMAAIYLGTIASMDPRIRAISRGSGWVDELREGCQGGVAGMAGNLAMGHIKMTGSPCPRSCESYFSVLSCPVGSSKTRPRAIQSLSGSSVDT